MHVTGNFKETEDFDPTTNRYNLTSNGDADIFSPKLSPSTFNSLQGLHGNSEMIIYPNPASSQRTIKYGVLETAISCEIKNISGEIVYIEVFKNMKGTLLKNINISALLPEFILFN